MSSRRLRVASLPSHLRGDRGPLPVLSTIQGIIVPVKDIEVATDWASIQSLYESGVPVSELSRHYKLSERGIARRAKGDGWLRPSDVEKLRVEIERKQKKVFKETGIAAPVAQVKAEILKERREKLKEVQLGIVEAAFDAVAADPDVQKKLIKGSKSFLDMVQAGRLVTGEEAEEASKRPGMAINIGLLRSGPRDAPADAIDVTEGRPMIHAGDD